MPRPETRRGFALIDGTSYECWWFENDPDAVYIPRAVAPRGKTSIWGRTTHIRGKTDDGRRWFVEG